MAQKEFLILILWRHRATSCLILFRSNRELNNQEHHWFLVSFIECQRASSFYYRSPRPEVGQWGQWERSAQGQSPRQKALPSACRVWKTEL